MTVNEVLSKILVQAGYHDTGERVSVGTGGWISRYEKVVGQTTYAPSSRKAGRVVQATADQTFWIWIEADGRLSRPRLLTGRRADGRGKPVWKYCTLKRAGLA